MSKQVDWHEQWKLFAENFYDGRAHIDLTPYGLDQELLLEPGPGFGDLSHPTTRLMMQMMHSHVKGRVVLDIGSGSGILSLASVLLGALSAVGVDIDASAILHARENARLNHLHDRATFEEKLPSKHEKSILLMNMIFPEQKLVMQNRGLLRSDVWILSGILEEQKSEYIKRLSEWGLVVENAYTLDGWTGYIATRSNIKPSS